MKILTIVGARPQFIKAAVFSKELKRQNIEEIMIHTGQHYDENMSKTFFDEFGIEKEKYNLNINQGTHGEQTSKMLFEIEKIILTEKPDYVVVFGDTNSTLAGALASSKLGFKLIHIEAGFRSYDKTMPEEINRVLTDHVSNYLFCVNDECAECLKKEGITKNVFVTGDLMYEALIAFSEKDSDILKTLNIEKDEYIYVTCHRESNVNKDNLSEILKGLANSNKKIIFALHPRTKKFLIETGLYKEYEQRINFIEPVSFHDSITLAKNSKLIITDSGGLLKESYYLKKPCLILRENVEFKEGIKRGQSLLVGTNLENITKGLNKEFNLDYEVKEIKTVSQKIIEVLKQ